MDELELKQAVLEAIAETAPEADVESVDPGLPLQDQLDIDSMDFLTFVQALHERTGIDIAERDYPRIATIDQCVAYLREQPVVQRDGRV